MIDTNLEHHHGHGTTRKSVPNYELCNDVESDLLVCDGLDHSDRDNVDKGCEGTLVKYIILSSPLTDYQCQNESPDGEFRRPNFDRNETEHEHGY